MCIEIHGVLFLTVPLAAALAHSELLYHFGLTIVNQYSLNLWIVIP